MVKARCPLHLNVTSALLDTLSDIQQQMTQLFVLMDAEHLRQRVSEIRVAQTAPGSGEAERTLTAVSTSIDRNKGRGGTRAARVGRTSSAGGLIGRGEYSRVSRYRHRDVLEYNDVFELAWPLDEWGNEVGEGLGRLPDAGIGSAASVSSDAGGSKARGSFIGEEGSSLVKSVRFRVCHQFAAPVPLESRMSFTILNLTGQRVRYFQPQVGNETRHLRYLRVRGVALCLNGTRAIFAKLHFEHVSGNCNEYPCTLELCPV